MAGPKATITPRNVVQRLSRVNSPGDIKDLLGLTLPEMGERLSRFRIAPTKKQKHAYDKSTVSHDINHYTRPRYRIPANRRLAWQLLLISYVELHAPGITVTASKSGWHFTAHRACQHCGHSFTLTRAGEHYCHRHRTAASRKHARTPPP